MPDAGGIREWLVALLLVAGTVVMVLGAVGLLRMPDVYTRAQAATKTSTLGVTLIFLASALHFAELAAVAQSLAVVAFAFLSVPLAAHMVTRAAHRTGADPCPGSERDELRRHQEDRPPP